MQAAIARLDSTKKQTRCMLIAHGNSGNIYTRDNLLMCLSGYQHDIYCFEYDGFGPLSESNRPTIANCVNNCIYWLGYLAKHYTEIDVYGESIGGGIIMDTLVTIQDTPQYRYLCDLVRNIYLQSTFCSIGRLLNKRNTLLGFLYYVIDWNDLDNYNNLLRLAGGFYNRRKNRIIIIHSKDDDIVPYSEAIDNLNRCHELKLSVDFYEIRGPHNYPMGLDRITV